MKRYSCTPRNYSVNLREELKLTNAVFFPRCLLVQRCGGNCGCGTSNWKSCTCVSGKTVKKYHEVLFLFPSVLCFVYLLAYVNSEGFSQICMWCCVNYHVTSALWSWAKTYWQAEMLLFGRGQDVSMNAHHDQCPSWGKRSAWTSRQHVAQKWSLDLVLTLFFLSVLDPCSIPHGAHSYPLLQQGWNYNGCQQSHGDLNIWRWWQSRRRGGLYVLGRDVNIHLWVS